MADVPPPASGRAFAFAVLERIERRRVWAEVADGMFLAMVACALLWVLAPAIGSFIQSTLALVSGPTFIATAALLLTVFVLTGGHSRAAWRL